MFQPQTVQIEWYKNNRVYIRTEMPFGTRLNLKLFEVFEVHFPTVTAVSVLQTEDVPIRGSIPVGLYRLALGGGWYPAMPREKSHEGTEAGLQGGQQLCSRMCRYQTLPKLTRAITRITSPMLIVAATTVHPRAYRSGKGSCDAQPVFLLPF
jgi:hypothetical protein